MLSRPFVDRPVLAGVISIVITLVGLVSVLTLPVDQYPYINPPAVKVSASFPGAAANTAANSVAMPLEQELNGLPGMLYMSSGSSKSGSVNITVTFEVGTDQDLAAVNVQNSAKEADSRLPVDVMQEGVSISKEASIELLKLALTSNEAKYDDVYLSNFMAINVADAVRRIPGVGRTRNTGSRSYSMRIWLRPDRMTAYGLTTSDVKNAIAEQNKESAAGTLGAQPNDDADLALTITTEGRLSSPEEFENIVVRADPNGAMIRLRDIARVELGASAYTLESKLNGQDAAILQVYLLPGANALTVADEVKRTMAELARGFPQGVDWHVWFDASVFIKASINEVLITLLEALLLVILVVYLFLQNWRTTLIPALAVPVSIIGTFAAMALMGFTLNTVNLLALVLAIGIVVDDAIVVVESVERLIKEGMDAKSATLRAMQELSGALVATSLVLAAVFVPVSFLAGITGILYREFALSITIAVLISTVVALTLSPALCAVLLRKEHAPPSWLQGVFGRIERWIDYGADRYTRAVVAVLKARKRAAVAFLVVLIGVGLMFKYLPGGFMPIEDQGRFFIDMELANGSSVARSKGVVNRAVQVIKAHPAVENVFSLAGESKRAGGNEGAGTLEVILKDWPERADGGYSVARVMADLTPQLERFVEVSVRAFRPPAIAGLGTGNGVELELQDRTGANAERLTSLADELVSRLDARREVADASTTLNTEIPLLKLNVDRGQAKALGIPLADIYGTMNVFTGSSNINDFNLFGRVYRVKMQAEAEYRDRAEALSYYYVRSASGAMVPLNVVADLEYGTGPATVTRHNMFTSASISATPAAGYASGDIVHAVEQIAEDILPQGFGYEWTGVTFQQIRSAGQTGIALALAVVFAYLFLAALYESWTIPIAVLLIAPVAMAGALGASWLRGMENNLFFQIAFIALIGLAAKNSILIVEYCRQLYQEGMGAVDAAIRAARMRFRPILMTALSFILGVMPLVLSSGPGAVARHSTSTPILGGMILATTLGILLVPLFFVTVVQMTDRRPAVQAGGEAAPHGA